MYSNIICPPRPATTSYAEWHTGWGLRQLKNTPWLFLLFLPSSSSLSHHHPSGTTTTRHQTKMFWLFREEKEMVWVNFVQRGRQGDFFVPCHFEIYRSLPELTNFNEARSTKAPSGEVLYTFEICQISSNPGPDIRPSFFKAYSFSTRVLTNSFFTPSLLVVIL